MEMESSQSRNLQLLTELEKRVTSLLEDYDRLAQENEMLKKQQEKLSLEKAGLHENHRQVHSKIESMLTRLKTATENPTKSLGTAMSAGNE